jgi:hypothetical protein
MLDKLAMCPYAMGVFLHFTFVNKNNPQTKAIASQVTLPQCQLAHSFNLSGRSSLAMVRLAKLKFASLKYTKYDEKNNNVKTTIIHNKGSIFCFLNKLQTKVKTGKIVAAIVSGE